MIPSEKPVKTFILQYTLNIEIMRLWIIAVKHTPASLFQSKKYLFWALGTVKKSAEVEAVEAHRRRGCKLDYFINIDYTWPPIATVNKTAEGEPVVAQRRKKDARPSITPATVNLTKQTKKADVK